MAQPEGTKPVHKNTVSWFEFLFDPTGDLLKKHLEDISPEPSATQLIVQFLDHSGLFNGSTSAARDAQGGASESPAPEKKEKRVAQVCRLALRAATHLQWNLDILEENLSLQWQNILLGELIKTTPDLDKVMKSDTDISSLDQKAATTLIIYYRWVVRTLSQHFLPNVGKPTNNGVIADNFANESILIKLEEQLPTAINILSQGLQVTEDMALPTAPPLLSYDLKKTTEPTEQDQNPCPEQDNASDGAATTSEEGTEKMEVDAADKDNAKSEGDAKNGSDDCNGTNTDEQMDTTIEEEVVKIKKEDIIAQISFDLATLYFYQEKFQQAMKLFESCKNAQCQQSSFYTVNEEKLCGYYMACCGLTGIPPVITSVAPLADSKPSLAVRLEQCRHSGYNDIIAVLLEDNVAFELPLKYRENLVTELRTHSRRMSEDEDSGSISLDWQIMVCNIIRDILEGRPTDPGFWLSLENCSQNQLDNIFSLCLQSVPVDEDFHPQGIKDMSNRFKVLKSFVQLICCNCELVNGWEIARNSAAKIFLDEEEEAIDDAQNGLVKIEQENLHLNSTYAQYNNEASSGQESVELKKGLLCKKLRHTVDPDEISVVVEQLHQLEKGRKHSEEFVCLLYKSHLEEIKNLQQQDILHILFSKALHCSAVQEYDKASQLLSYALGMVNTVAGRGAVSSPLQRVKAAIHQELLVLDICNESQTKRSDEISNRIKSYICQTAPGQAKTHIEEQVTAFLLNGKQWEFLSELKMDENAQSLDHRSLCSFLASTCYLLSKPQAWRKPAKSLWDGILKIFANNTGQQKRTLDGSQGSVATQVEGLKLTSFIHFIRKIKDETVLTVLISCLVRLRNACNKSDEANSQKEISSSHSHLWPTAITNPGNVNFDHIGLALSGVVHHALSVHQHNVSWLQTLGDIYLDSGNYSSALRCYLEAGAVSSLFFNSPVPSTVWDDQVYRKMVTCCSVLKAHIQAALLCQCMEVKDYTTAFKALQQASSASSDAMDFYYSFFWDMTMLEYLTYTHAKRGQNDKKLLTIQAISQPDLNIFNTSELLQHTEQSRKAKLLRTLAKQYL